MNESYQNEMLSRVEQPQWFVPSLIEDWEDETCQACAEHFRAGELIGEVRDRLAWPEVWQEFIHERCYRAAQEESE